MPTITVPIQTANNPRLQEKTKQIEVDCHFIKQHVLLGLLNLPHVSSQDQLADLLNKSLHGLTVNPYPDHIMTFLLPY